jgi:uncharacterized membrane protein YdbT with pleckstrin-like domain
MSSKPLEVHGPDPRVPTMIQLAYLFLPTLLGTAFAMWVIYSQYIQNQYLAGLAAIFLVAIPLSISLGWTFKKWNVIEYRIYDDQLEEKVGVFSTTKRAVDYEEITDVEKTQTYVEKKLDLADIVIQTAGKEEPVITMEFVSQPQKTYDLINQRAD